MLWLIVVIELLETLHKDDFTTKGDTNDLIADYLYKL